MDGQVGESPTRLVAYEFRAAACICASPRGRGRNYARNSDRSLVSFVSEEEDRRRRDLEEEIRDGDVYSDEGGLEIVVAVPRGNGTDPGEREGGSSREEAGLVPTAPRLPSRRYFEARGGVRDAGAGLGPDFVIRPKRSVSIHVAKQRHLLHQLLRRLVTKTT